MGKRGLMVGIIFVSVGIAGLLATYIYFHYAVIPLARKTPFDRGLTKKQKEGKLIYYFGINANGRRIRFNMPGMHTGMRTRMNMGCVKCHGRDGKGGTRFGGERSVDIRWNTLEKEGFNFYKFMNAVRKGRDEKGEMLSPIMPRWRMRAQELISLKAYLETLD